MKKIKLALAVALVAAASTPAAHAGAFSDLVDTVSKAVGWNSSQEMVRMTHEPLDGAGHAAAAGETGINITIREISNYCTLAGGETTTTHLPPEGGFQRYDMTCSVKGKPPVVVQASQSGGFFAATIQPVSAAPAICEHGGMESVFVKESGDESIRICMKAGKPAALVYSSFSGGVFHVIAKE